MNGWRRAAAAGGVLGSMLRSPALPGAALLMIACLAAAPPPARAQRSERSRFALEAGALGAGLNPNFAARQDVRARSLGLRGALVYSWEPRFALGVEVATLPLAGRAPHPEPCTAHDALGARWFSVLAGVRVPAAARGAGGAVSMGLDGGYSWIGGSRTTWLHAPSQRAAPAGSRALAIRGGAFLEPSLGFGATGSTVLLRYRVFEPSADVRGALSIALVVALPEVGRSPTAPRVR